MQRKLYLSKLFSHKDQKIVKFITGLRYCGKTALLEQFIDCLKNENISEKAIIYLRLASFENKYLLDSETLFTFVTSRLRADRKNYVFLDDVHLCKNPQCIIERLFSIENIDLYVSGIDIFNGACCSFEKVVLEVQPFSFSEWLEYAAEKGSAQKDVPAQKDGAKNVQYVQEDVYGCFCDYVSCGGLPFALQFYGDFDNWAQYLTGVYSTIVVKDIIGRHCVKDVDSLERVVDVLVKSCGKFCTSKKISEHISASGGKVSQPTVENYMRFIEECFFVYRVERYDVRQKKILKNLQKVYVADTGFVNLLLGKVDKARALENLVYAEFRRQGFKVYVGKNLKSEIDFVVLGAGVTLYVQVVESVADENILRRELCAFKNIPDAYPRILITMDKDAPNDFNGVRNINALDFLSGKVSLGF